MEVRIDSFGKDHWSTFAYIESVCVDHKGIPDIRRMRTDKTRHPGLSHAWNPDTFDCPTILKGGALLYDHDDWDCVDELKKAGLITIEGTGIHPILKMTEKGGKIASQLRMHKANGGKFADFSVE